jgi:deoxyribodipyrimidine photo-lyase
LWRDFFRIYAMKHGDRIFALGGPARSRQRWRADNAELRRWKDGALGV